MTNLRFLQLSKHRADRIEFRNHTPNLCSSCKQGDCLTGRKALTYRDLLSHSKIYRKLASWPHWYWRYLLFLELQPQFYLLSSLEAYCFLYALLSYAIFPRKLPPHPYPCPNQEYLHEPLEMLLLQEKETATPRDPVLPRSWSVTIPTRIDQWCIWACKVMQVTQKQETDL